MARLPRLPRGFDAGAAEFLRLLRGLERIDGLHEGWRGQGRLLWQQQEEFIERFRAENSKDHQPGDMFVIRAGSQLSGPQDITSYFFELTWEAFYVDTLEGDFRTMPRTRQGEMDWPAMIEAIVAWRRPQHLRLGPWLYTRDHHPLDRSREGIGWMGWIPFPLSASDVPEAELVRPMLGGSLIIVQSEFWQANPRHPLYSQPAIERAQEVDLRLHLLGVLPSPHELQRGDWGQSR